MTRIAQGINSCTWASYACQGIILSVNSQDHRFKNNILPAAKWAPQPDDEAQETPVISLWSSMLCLMSVWEETAADRRVSCRTRLLKVSPPIQVHVPNYSAQNLHPLCTAKKETILRLNKAQRMDTINTWHKILFWWENESSQLMFIHRTFFKTCFRWGFAFVVEGFLLLPFHAFKVMKFYASNQMG